MPRHFLTGAELDAADLGALLDRALELKAAPRSSRALEGRSIGLVFEKPSTRTRVSFEVGVVELGGHPLILRPDELQLSRGEPLRDTALVLSRHLDAVGVRTGPQAVVDELAAAGSIPVFNMLTAVHHPCQVLADLQTVRAAHGRLAGLTLAFLGDGSSNMAHSYLLGGATAGMHVRIGAPQQYQPDRSIVAQAARIAERTGGSVEVDADPKAACHGADVLATDVWASMGQEDQEAQRLAALSTYGPDDSYRLDEPKLALAAPGCVVLHCLPAHRGTEIAAEVLDGPASVVWDEAENRLHAQKALLTWLLERARLKEAP